MGGILPYFLSFCCQRGTEFFLFYFAVSTIALAYYLFLCYFLSSLFMYGNALFAEVTAFISIDKPKNLLYFQEACGAEYLE